MKFKRRPFSLQKTAFWNAKDGILKFKHISVIISNKHHLSLVFNQKRVPLSTKYKLLTFRFAKEQHVSALQHLQYMIKTLQSYRFIFVLMVFFSHFSWNDVAAFDFGGECGVSFFFILSGFVLSVSAAERNLKNYPRKTFITKQLAKFYLPARPYALYLRNTWNKGDRQY